MAPDTELPSWQTLSDQYNGRIDKLEYLAARGTISLRWRDEHGQQHSEPQGELDLWLHLPASTALSIDKLGQRYFWIGSDDEQFWMFDLAEEPTTLFVGRHDDFIASRTPIGLHPLTMLDLLGLTRLADKAGAARLSADGNSIVVQLDGPSGRVDIHLDPQTRLPVRSQARDEAGEVVMTCEMRDYKPAFLPGTMVLQHPMVPGVCEFRDSADTLHIRVQLEAPTCDTQGQPYPRVFELSKLTEHLKPARTQRLDEPAAEPSATPQASLSSGDAAN